MKKNSKFALSFLACLTLAVGTLVVAAKTVDSTPFKQTRVVDRTISFIGMESTTQYDNVNNFLSIKGQLQDGDFIYMGVANPANYDSVEYKFTTNENTYIYFAEDETCDNEYRFQNIQSMRLYHDSSESERSYSVNVFADNGNPVDGGTYSIAPGTTYTDVNVVANMRRVRIFFWSEAITLSELSIIYSCSYDYEEPLKTIEIYATNDFHGTVLPEGNSMGLETWGTFLKARGAEENTLLLDQGDTWQGSIYSNYNHGELVNDVMTVAGFDARTIGNHDFDWGVEAVENNTKREVPGYPKVPVLGANIYGYNFKEKQFTDEQKSELGIEYITKTLENGVKIGIVGVIGEDQITSINSLYTQNIGFRPHIGIIKDLATYLKNRPEGPHCDAVICSIHADETAVLGNDLNQYVDLVLCGHSHDLEYQTREGNLRYAQFGEYSEYIGHISLTIDTEKNKVADTYIEPLNRIDVESMISEPNQEIQNLIEDAVEDCDDVANEEVATNVTTFPSGSESEPYFLNTRDYSYYKWNSNKWNKLGNVFNDNTPSNYETWNTEEEIRTEGFVEGKYYIDLVNKVYYQYQNESLGSGTSFVEGTDKTLKVRYCNAIPNFKSYGILENVMSKAIYDQAASEGHGDIKLVYLNNARASIEKNTWTYKDLYKSFPFDNTIYIIEVTGKEIYDEIMPFNFIYKVPGFDEYDIDTKYKIACLDYLTFHTNSSRYYDYFPDNDGKYIDTLSKNYRVILKDWLVANGYNSGKQLSILDFSSDNYSFRKDMICTTTRTITLNYNYDGSENDGIYKNNATGHYGKTFSNEFGVPLRTGYAFAGWFLEPECVHSAGPTIAVDGTYYANWITPHAGTELDPYSVSEALVFASQHNSTSGLSPVYCYGTVSREGTRIGSSGDIGNVYIMDEYGSEILIYFISKYQGATIGNNFENKNDLKVGDELLICGIPYNYKGTLEFASGSYCVSINGETTSPSA